MAYARATDPQTSHDAAANINVHAADKNKPSPELKKAVLIVAEQLTSYSDHGNFNDAELAKQVLPYLRMLNVKCKEQTSSVRRARLWLSEQDDPRIVLVEGRRDGSQLWKYVPPAAPAKTIQREMFG